jgi:hypothetical protein
MSGIGNPRPTYPWYRSSIHPPESLSFGRPGSAKLREALIFLAWVFRVPTCKHITWAKHLNPGRGDLFIAVGGPIQKFCFAAARRRHGY